MGGQQLFREVEKQDPQLARRIVFITGDTADPLTRDFLGRSGNPWLPKPFGREAVMKALELGGAPGGPERSVAS